MIRRPTRSRAAVTWPALLMAGLAILPLSAGAQGSPIQAQSVLLGLPRTALVPGFLDFEAACRVTASYQGVSMRDGESASTFLAVAPDACDMAVYVLGIRLALPVASATPLGRTSYSIPGVSGFTFGLGDVSVDLTTSLRGDSTPSASTLSVSPSAMDWPIWGAVPTMITAQSGLRGSTLVTTAPYTLSLAFGLGVSVYALGLRIYSWDATVATAAGTPLVEIPVSIDLPPSVPEIGGVAALSPYLVQVTWTQNHDDDFTAYEVSVSGGAEPHVLLVSDASRTSLRMDAAPATDYVFVVTVVDGSGQRATSTSSRVTTPAAPTPSVGQLAQLPLLVTLLAAGLVAGFAISRSSRRAKASRRVPASFSHSFRAR